MDVLRAANEREAAGADRSSISKSASPAPRRRQPVLEAARARARQGADRLYRRARHRAVARTRSPGITAAQYGIAVDPGRDRRHDRLVGRLSAGVSRRLRARRPGGAGGARLSGLPQHPVGARDRAGADRGRRERALPAEPRSCSPRPATLDGLIIASPANPTGTMIAAGELARLAGCCRDHGIRLISDEIYHGITYETPAATARAFGREAIIVNSFSKYYSMTGWRLGWMLVPPDLARSVECLAQNFYISPPALSQMRRVPGVRLPRRARRPCRALPRQPRPADRDAAEGRARPASLRPRAPSTSMSTCRA